MTGENLADLRGQGIVCAPVLSVSEAVEQPWLAPLLPSTSAPDGRRIRLPPSVCGEEPREYAFAPRAGEHTESVLREAGLSPSEIEELTGSGAAMAAVER